MDQSMEQWRAERRWFIATLREIGKAVDVLDALPRSGLRTRTDDLRAFVAGIVVSRAASLPAADEAELRRLSSKLEALSQRLLYSYFGPAQLQLLEAAVSELDAIIERYVLLEGDVPAAFADEEVGAGSRQEVLTG